MGGGEGSGMDSLHVSQGERNEKRTDGERSESYSDGSQRGQMGEASLLWDNLYRGSETHETAQQSGTVWQSSLLVAGGGENTLRPSCFNPVDLLQLKDVDIIQTDPIGSLGVTKSLLNYEGMGWRGTGEIAVGSGVARGEKTVGGIKMARSDIEQFMENPVNKSAVETNPFLSPNKLYMSRNPGMREEPSHTFTDFYSLNS